MAQEGVPGEDSGANLDPPTRLAAIAPTTATTKTREAKQTNAGLEKLNSVSNSTSRRAGVVAKEPISGEQIPEEPNLKSS